MTITLRILREAWTADEGSVTETYEISVEQPYNPTVVSDMRGHIIGLAAEDAATQWATAQEYDDALEPYEEEGGE